MGRFEGYAVQGLKGEPPSKFDEEYKIDIHEGAALNSKQRISSMRAELRTMINNALGENQYCILK